MSTPAPEHLKNTVGKALGRVPSGLFILTVTTGDASPPAATLVSWVQQVGFDPPAVSMAVAKDRPIRGLIAAAGRFALSVLGEGDNDMLRRYARPIPPGTDPFEGVETLRSDAGLPVLARGIAWMDCQLMQVCDVGGDHDLFVARVTAGALLKAGPSFMHVRGNGFHY
jgi:flavin reductase (DIM6/NTAB) family NADH-FMN oxidoreductase RutF